MTRYRWGITGACILFLAGVIVYNLHEFLAYDYLVYYAGGKSINWFLDYPSDLYDLDILREIVRAETLDIFSATAVCGWPLHTHHLLRSSLFQRRFCPCGRQSVFIWHFSCPSLSIAPRFCVTIW